MLNRIENINENRDLIIQEFNEKFAQDIEQLQILYQKIEKEYNEDSELLQDLTINQAETQKIFNENEIAISLLKEEIEYEHVDENKKNEHKIQLKELEDNHATLQNKLNQIPELEKRIEINQKNMLYISSNLLYLEGIALKELKDEIENTEHTKSLMELIADYNKLKPQFESNLNKLKTEINSTTLERLNIHAERIDTLAHFQEVVDKIIDSSRKIKDSIDTTGDTIRPLSEVLRALPPVRAAIVGVVGIWETGKMWAEKKIEKGVWDSKEGNIAWKTLKTIAIGGVIATAVVGAVIGTLLTALIAMGTGAVKDCLVFIDAEKKLRNIDKKLRYAEGKLRNLNSKNNQNSNIQVNARINLIQLDIDKYRYKQKEVKRVRNEKAADFILTAASVLGVGMLFVFPPVGVAILTAATLSAIVRVTFRNRKKIGNFFGSIKNKFSPEKKEINEFSEDKKEKLEIKEDQAHIFEMLASHKKNGANVKKDKIQHAIEIAESNIEALREGSSSIDSDETVKVINNEIEDNSSSTEVKSGEQTNNSPHRGKK